MDTENAITWTANLRIEKYNDDDSFRKGIPDEVQHIKGNTATMIGLFTLWNLAMGKGTSDPDGYTYNNISYTVEGFYPLSHDNAYIGVGTGTSQESLNDTGLSAGEQSSRAYVQAEVNYPAIDSANPNIMQVKAVFGSTVAAFSWQEWGVFNGNPDNPGQDRSAMNDSTHTGNIVMFNHKVEDMGTKSANATWVIIGDFVLSPTAT